MGINWLNMAQLGRTVTGLDWGRFIRAQLPAAMLAAVIGVAAMLAAEAARSAHLGKVPVVLVCRAGGRDDGPGGLPAASPAVPRAARHLGHQAGYGAAAGRGPGAAPAAEADGLAPAGKAGAP